MKKLLLLAFILVKISVVHAQAIDTTFNGRLPETERPVPRFKSFRVQLSFGTTFLNSGKINGSGFSGGLIGSLEPSYTLADRLALGIRIETEMGQVRELAAIDFNYIVSGLVTVNYYFGNSRVRPFVGAGLGIFTTDRVRPDETDHIPGDSFIQYGPPINLAGGMLRTGFEFGHLHVEAEYNFMRRPSLQLSSDNYFAVKIGVTMGGGRKKK